MASLDSLKVRALAAKGAIQVSRDDTPVVLRMRYVGTGTLTSITITTATNLVVVSSDGGTDTYAFATYTTVGALADAINSDGILECKVIDALRADSTGSSMFLENTALSATTDENGVTCYDAHADTSVFKALTSTLSLSRNFNTGTQRLFSGHRVHLQEIVYYANVNAAAANSVRVYFRKGTVETQQFGVASVDATKTTINWAAGLGKLTAPEDADIIVRVLDGTSLTDAADNFIQATGIYE